MKLLVRWDESNQRRIEGQWRKGRKPQSPKWAHRMVVVSLILMALTGTVLVVAVGTQRWFSALVGLLVLGSGFLSWSMSRAALAVHRREAALTQE